LADQRITQLNELPKASVAQDDVLPIVDISASETKKVTAQNLVDAGLDLIPLGSVDLDKLDQSSTTKLGTTALADDAVTAAKLGANSAIAVGSTAPSTDNFSGRGFFNSSTGLLQVYSAGAYANVVASVGTGAVDTAELADGAVTTAKVDAAGLGTAAIANDAITADKIADDAVTSAQLATDSVTADAIGSGQVGTDELAAAAVTYAKIQNVSATDKLLGRSTAGAGSVEEITCTAAGRALLDDADAAAQRSTLGLGTLSTANGTWTDGSSFSGTSSGTNTGDQTITLTGDVTGSGTGSFAATIASNAVTEAKINALAVTTGKIADDAVTAIKLADNSAAVVAAATPSGSGGFIGQQWYNTNTNIEYTWDGSAWVRQAGIGTITFSDSTPLAFAVAYPDAYSATITTTMDTQAANVVLAGPESGVDAAPTFRALVPADLPDATVSTKGIIVPGSGLSVSSGTLNHSNSVTAGTYTKVTVDAEGHVSTGATLDAADIPNLDAAKITTGSFSASFLASDSVTAPKLADYSTAQIGEAIPVADYIGQLFFNPLDKNIYLWDGNVWQPVGVSLGELIFAGTYDANLNEVVTTTTVGAAVGLVAGDPLPVASSTYTSYYVVVAVGGTGVAPAPEVALAPPDIILCDGSSWNEIDVSSTYVAQTASNVGFTPAGTIASTNVQGAVEEVATEAANASNLTSGTVAVARGGTNISSYTKGDLLAASASTTLTKLGVGTNGQVLRANSATATGLEWGVDYVGTVTSVTGSAPISVATGTTTPVISVSAASTSAAGVVQLSDSTSTTSSVLAATSTAVKSAYDLADAAMPKAGGTFTGDVTLGATRTLIFEGSTDDGFETTLTVADPTADRTITLPNATGTVALTSDLSGYGLLDGAQTWTKGQRGEITALTDGATITPDFADSNNFSVTLGGNRTLANPTNLVAGQSGCIWITQDGTGGRTLAYGSSWDFTGGTAPTVTSTANARSCLVYAVQSTTQITATLITNLS
jgi:hypothetical protein